MTCNIAIAGVHDALTVKLAEKLCSKRDVSLTGIAQEAYPNPNISRWRLGSQISSVESQNILQGMDYAFYFCLTPPSYQRFHLGNARDIALISAIHFVQDAARQGVKRIFIFNRICPEEESCVNLSLYLLWRQIESIFIESGLKISIIRCAPIISEFAPLFSLASQIIRETPLIVNPQHLLRLTQPILWEDVEKQILEQLDLADSLPDTHIIELVGKSFIPYGDFLSEMAHIAGKRILPVTLIPKLFRNTGRGIDMFSDDCRWQLLQETLQITTTATNECEFRRCSAYRPDDIENAMENADLNRKHVLSRIEANIIRKVARENFTASKATQTSCYATTLLLRPKRSVEDIAKLFLQWVPKHFSKLVHIESDNTGVYIYRIIGMPVIKVQMMSSTQEACQLHVSSTHFGPMEKPFSILFANIAHSRPQCSTVGVLIENYPNSFLSVRIIREVLLSFSSYLQEFSIGIRPGFSLK